MVVKTLEQALGHTIRGRVIIYTMCGAVTIVYAASLAILEAERGQPESEINTFGDALWWAMTTVTTVGYGDLRIVTSEGRMVAVALMIGGITLLGIVTATLASWIVQRVSEEDTASRGGHGRADRRAARRDSAPRGVDESNAMKRETGTKWKVVDD